MWLLCWQEEKHYISPQLQTTLAYVPFNTLTIFFNKLYGCRLHRVFFEGQFEKRQTYIDFFHGWYDAFPYLGLPVLTKCLLVSLAQPQFLFYPNFNQLYHLNNIKNPYWSLSTDLYFTIQFGIKESKHRRRKRLDQSFHINSVLTFDWILLHWLLIKLVSRALLALFTRIC